MKTSSTFNPFWDLSITIPTSRPVGSSVFQSLLGFIKKVVKLTETGKVVVFQSLLGFIKAEEEIREIEKQLLSIPFGIYHKIYA